MRIVKTTPPENSIWWSWGLALIGRGPEVEAAQRILDHHSAVATQEIARLAEEVYGCKPQEVAKYQSLMLTCRCVVREAYRADICPSVHEVLFDAFIFLHHDELTNDCCRLMAHLLTNRREEYVPHLERYIRSRLDTDRVFAAGALMRLNNLTTDDAARLLRVIKDPSPRVAAAARGGLFQLYITSDDITPLVEEAIASLNPEVLEAALIPSLTSSSRRLALHTLLSWRWYSFAIFVREALQNRTSKEGKQDGLQEVTNSLQRHSFAIFFIQNLMVVGLLIMIRMSWIVFSSSTTPIITGTEIMALQIAILVLIGFLATAFSFRLVRVLSPILRYRTLKPLPHLLSLLEDGCGDEEVARDLALASREDVRAQRQVLRLALDEAPGASKALLHLVQQGVISPELLEDQGRMCANSKEEKERFVSLLAEICALPQGRILAQHFLDGSWRFISDSGNLDVLLDSNVPLVPPLLKRATEKLRVAPIDSYRLLLQVCVEAPHVYPTYRSVFIEGLGYMLHEGLAYPDVVQHFLQLYPNDVYRALIRGYKFRRRDAEARAHFVDAIDRDAIRTFFTSNEAYRLTRSPVVVDRLKTNIIERTIDEEPQETLRILFELAGAGLPKEIFSFLPATLRDDTAAALADAFSQLMFVEETSCEKHLKGAANALADIEGADAAALTELVSCLQSVACATDLETVRELGPRLMALSEDKSAALAGMRPTAPLIRELYNTLGWALDATGAVERSSCLLRVHGLLLDLIHLVKRRVMRPHRNVLLALCSRIRRKVASALHLGGPSPTFNEPALRLRPHRELRSTDKELLSGQTAVAPGFLGEATALLRSFWSIIAPIPLSPQDVAGEPPKDFTIAKLRLGEALQTVERGEWIDGTGVWPAWSIPQQLRDQAMNEVATILDWTLAQTDVGEKADLLLSVSVSSARDIRRSFLPLISQHLQDCPQLRKAYGKLAICDDLEDPTFPLRLEPLHMALLNTCPPDEEEIDYLLTSLRDVRWATELAPGSLACVGRAAATNKGAAEQIVELDNELSPLQTLPAHLELAHLGATGGFTSVERALRSAGKKFDEGPLFPALILFTPPRGLRAYRHWLNALFETTRKVGQFARDNDERAYEFLESLLQSDNCKIVFAAALELAVLALGKEEHEARIKELMALPVFALEEELRSYFIAALLRRERNKFWPIVEEMTENGELPIEATLGALREYTPRDFDGPLSFIFRNRNLLLAADQTSLLRQAYQLTFDNKVCWHMLRDFVLHIPTVFLHPTQEAFWVNAMSASGKKARDLLAYLVEEKGSAIPLRHLVGPLRHFVALCQTDDEDELLSLCQRFRGDTLAALGELTQNHEKALVILCETLENRKAKPEERRSAVIGLARASVSSAAGFSACNNYLSQGRLTSPEREALARELVNLMPRSPETVTRLIVDHKLLDLTDVNQGHIIGLLAGSCPDLQTSSLLAYWNSHTVHRLRSVAPSPITSVIAHILLLLERGRMEGYRRAFERALSGEKMLARLQEVRGYEPPEKEAELRQDVFDFLRFACSVANEGSKESDSQFMPKARTNINGLCEATISLGVLDFLSRQSDITDEAGPRLIYLTSAERAAQEVLLHGLSTLPTPLAEPAAWLTGLLAERVEDIKARPIVYPNLKMEVLSQAVLAKAKGQIVMSVHNDTGATLRSPTAQVTLRGSSGTLVEEIGLQDVRPGARAFYRLPVSIPGSLGEELSLLVELSAHPLPGQSIFLQQEKKLKIVEETPPILAPLTKDDVAEDSFHSAIGGEALPMETAERLLMGAINEEQKKLLAPLLQEVCYLTSCRPAWLVSLATALENHGLEEAVASLRSEKPEWISSLYEELSDKAKALLETIAELSIEGVLVTSAALDSRLKSKGADYLAGRYDVALSSLLEGSFLIERSDKTLQLPCPLTEQLFVQKAQVPVVTQSVKSKITPFPRHRLG